MIKPAFTWHPDLGAQQHITSSVQQTKFGDGYELRVAKGINLTPRTWEVSFTRGPSEAKDILAFLEARAGLESFAWTDPLDREGTYVCREWGGGQQAFGVYVVSATFEQVFEY